ncbi:uncharacterized protein LOC124692170 isoform X2 [Lolium rigidum]|uniref:uncharacterized protein LOC124692170 isoform X2 n=1 Tax=Lolium rigidum TaxID=89674 RepID=UPI001F5D2F04|nr:uncharacterized protein LOC124692170 isoform X2 [Lolium rigidum]
MRLRREVTKCELCLLDGKSAPTLTWDSIESMPITQILACRYGLVSSSIGPGICSSGEAIKKRIKYCCGLFLGAFDAFGFRIFSHWEPSVSSSFIGLQTKFDSPSMPLLWRNN